MQNLKNACEIHVPGWNCYSSVISNAQTDTSKVELYCQLVATLGILSHKVTFDIDRGEEKLLWRDNRLTTLDGNLSKFNTIIDAMNYLWLSGWVLLMLTRFVWVKLIYTILILKSNSPDQNSILNRKS